MGQLAARWGVSPRWLRKLLERWRRTGAIPRMNPRRRPPGPPLSRRQEQLILETYRATPRGATKLYLTLLRRGIRIPKMKIYRFAQAQGWVKANRRKQRPRSRVRYERAHSGSLVHGDYHRTSETHPHCILWEDDASRMLLSGGEFRTATTAHAIATLQIAIRPAARWNLEIREVNTDRGCQFYASERENTPVVGEAVFQRFLRSQGIRHVVSRAPNPQANGKSERIWLEYDRHRLRFATMFQSIDWYNDQVNNAH